MKRTATAHDHHFLTAMGISWDVSSIALPKSKAPRPTALELLTEGLKATKDQCRCTLTGDYTVKRREAAASAHVDVDAVPTIGDTVLLYSPPYHALGGFWFVEVVRVDSRGLFVRIVRPEIFYQMAVRYFRIKFLHLRTGYHRIEGVVSDLRIDDQA